VVVQVVVVVQVEVVDVVEVVVVVATALGVVTVVAGRNFLPATSTLAAASVVAVGASAALVGGGTVGGDNGAIAIAVVFSTSWRPPIPAGVVYEACRDDDFTRFLILSMWKSL